MQQLPHNQCDMNSMAASHKRLHGYHQYSFLWTQIGEMQKYTHSKYQRCWQWLLGQWQSATQIEGTPDCDMIKYTHKSQHRRPWNCAPNICARVCRLRSWSSCCNSRWEWRILGMWYELRETANHTPEYRTRNQASHRSRWHKIYCFFFINLDDLTALSCVDRNVIRYIKQKGTLNSNIRNWQTFLQFESTTRPQKIRNINFLRYEIIRRGTMTIISVRVPSYQYVMTYQAIISVIHRALHDQYPI